MACVPPVLECMLAMIFKTLILELARNQRKGNADWRRAIRERFRQQAT